MPHKFIIFVHVLPVLVPYFVEAVHVELPDERREVAMLEIFGQNGIREPVDILDAEGILVLCPVDILGTTLILHYT